MVKVEDDDDVDADDDKHDADAKTIFYRKIAKILTYNHNVPHLKQLQPLDLKKLGSKKHRLQLLKLVLAISFNKWNIGLGGGGVPYGGAEGQCICLIGCIIQPVDGYVAVCL